MAATRVRTSSAVWAMPARSITKETARSPISRYDVCSRPSKASIIEFSKCVRRHQVTKAFGMPVQFFDLRNGVATSTSPDCMSTTVPYWSNMQTLMADFRRRGSVMAVSVRAGDCRAAAGTGQPPINVQQ